MMRIRLRTLLVVVAVIAVGLAFGLTRHAPRRAFYLKQAAEETLWERDEKTQEQVYLNRVREWTNTVKKLERWSKETDFVFNDGLRRQWNGLIADDSARAAIHTRRAAVHAQRKRGYERAAAYPWAEPPTPEPRATFNATWGDD